MVGQVRVESIDAAAEVIEPVFRNTPQVADPSLARRLGRDLVVKLETFNPIRSFKGRGASYYMRAIEPGTRVVCASAGNFGQAVAFAGQARGIDVTVFVARDANPAKVTRMKELGAHVVSVGEDFDAAKDAARAYAGGSDDRLFVEDGDDPRIAEGAGTIAIEIAQLRPDVILVPVGNGALVTGIGCWMKACSPQTTIVGICASGAPAMAESWRRGEPVSTDRAHTIADGVAVRVPVPAVVKTLRDYVDDMVLIDEDDIWQALRVARDTLGLVLEPAGALGIAAALRHDFAAPTVVTIVTGSNFSDDLLAELLAEPQKVA